MCFFFFSFVRQIGSLAVALVDWYRRFITAFVRLCRQGPCYKWCLCCDRWLCWIALIVVAVLFFVFLLIFFVMYVITTIVVWLACELLCIAIIFLFVFPANLVIIIGWVLFSWLHGRELELWDGPRCFALRPPSSGPSDGSGSGSGSGGLRSPDGTPPGPGTTTGTGGVTSTPRSRTMEEGWWSAARLAAAADGGEASRYCGCREGQIGMLTGLVVFVAYVSATGAWGSIATTQHAATAIGLALIGGLIGKTAGMLSARATV